MNAYELADEAKRQVELIYLVTDESIAKQLATMLDNYAKMLRQQADRIAELERLVSDMIYEKSSGVYDRPQIKELSDEEILNVAFCCEVNTVAIENDWDGTVIDFARAILKKASEK
jgi:hypothetical protein